MCISVWGGNARWLPTEKRGRGRDGRGALPFGGLADHRQPGAIGQFERVEADIGRDIEIARTSSAWSRSGAARAPSAALLASRAQLEAQVLDCCLHLIGVPGCPVVALRHPRQFGAASRG